MVKFTSSLERLHVAAPCKAEWDEMMGNDRVRFCGQCQKNVYNLSHMTMKEAERVIANREGGLCVRFYRRSDGTVITTNCPVGLRAIKRRISRLLTAFLSATMSFLTGIAAYAGLTPQDIDPAEVAPVAVVETVAEEPAQAEVGEYTTFNGGI